MEKRGSITKEVDGFWFNVCLIIWRKLLGFDINQKSSCLSVSVVVLVATPLWLLLVGLLFIGPFCSSVDKEHEWYKRGWCSWPSPMRTLLMSGLGRVMGSQNTNPNLISTRNYWSPPRNLTQKTELHTPHPVYHTWSPQIRVNAITEFKYECHLPFLFFPSVMLIFNVG